MVYDFYGVYAGTPAAEDPNDYRRTSGCSRSPEKMEVIRSFSYLLPAIVIDEMFGVPATHREQIKRWADDLASFMEGRFGGLIHEVDGKFLYFHICKNDWGTRHAYD